ncbi:hypothetical protein LZ198_42380, partial [Myxococcus sp. K15C18031901]|nr:hypothetical protein [Myxococcus dinghuensis]
MRRKRSCLAVLLLLLSGVSWAEDVQEPQLPEPIEEAPQENGKDERWTNLFRVEATTWTLLPREGQ